MKQFFALVVLIFLVSKVCNAQSPTIQWQKCFGGSLADLAHSIQQTIDGGYIIAGQTGSNDSDVSGFHGGWDIWVVKINSTGSIQWQRCLGGSSIENTYSVLQTADEGYIVAGSTNSNDGDVSGNHGSADIWIVKLDSTGIILWQKCLGGSLGEDANSIQETTDGGFIVSGFSESNDFDVSINHGGGDFWIVKLNTSGNILWEKSFGGSGNDISSSIRETIDHGYIVSGVTDSNDGDVSGNHGNQDCWVVKIDSIGDVQWQKCFGGSADEQINSIQQTPDRGYIFAAETFSNDSDVSGNHGSWDYWIVKLDSTGIIQWQKCLGGLSQDHAYSIQLLHDGSYLIAGRTSSSNGDVTGNHSPGSEDYWVVNLDSTGSLEWQKCLGGSLSDLTYSIQQTTDGGYIISGWTNSNDGDVTGNHGWYDFWIVKLTPLGLQTPELKNNLQDLTVFLTNDQINLRFFSKTNRDAQFSIYNLEGQQIFSEEAFITEGINHHSINCSSFTNGIYFLKIDGKDFSMGVKVVVGVK